MSFKFSFRKTNPFVFLKEISISLKHFFVYSLIENQFRGVTKDEVEFLDQLAQHTMEKEKLLHRDVQKELADFKISFANQFCSI